MSQRPRAGLRRIPLKVAGVLGIFSAGLYLAVILGPTDPSRTPGVIVWLVLVGLAGVLSWLADDSPRHGRLMAMGAAGLFFVLGLFASTVLMVIFLVALVLSVLGFAGVPKPGTNA